MLKNWIALRRRNIMFLMGTGPLICLLLVSCHKMGDLVSPTRTSFLLIAVDGLGINDVGCYRDNRANLKSGFEILCQESVRFTHSYSTSNLSLPAMASILTAEYPFQNQVRDNSSNLSSQVVSLAEIAYKQKYHTAFFSGGPSILRRSGLQQGFELFDDNVMPSQSRLYRPIGNLVTEFDTWLKELNNDDFFAVLYVADINFKNNITINELGEPRSFSTESQIEEVDTSLYRLVEILRKKHLWNNTEIILVGLNGRTLGNSQNFDQKSSALQVATLIKPAQKPRDQGINWSVDPYINLIDIGFTLAQQINSKFEFKDSTWPAVNLSSSLTQPTLRIPERWILSESAWPHWRSTIPDRTPIHYSFRKDPYLIVADNKLHAYNTLIDKTEQSPLPTKELGQLTELKEIQKNLLDLNWFESKSVAEDLVTEFDKSSISLEGRSCLNLLDQIQNQKVFDKKICNDTFSLNLADYLISVISSDPSMLDWNKRKLIRTAYYYYLDKKIAEQNKEQGFPWDLPIGKINEISAAELFLSRPENSKEKNWLMKEVSAIRD